MSNPNITPKNKRTSIPILTKFEKAEVLKTRIEQLNANQDPYIQLDTIDPYNVALQEFEQGYLDDLIIKREFPNGKIEYIPLGELDYDFD